MCKEIGDRKTSQKYDEPKGWRAQRVRQKEIGSPPPLLTASQNQSEKPLDDVHFPSLFDV